MELFVEGEEKTQSPGPCWKRRPGSHRSTDFHSSFLKLNSNQFVSQYLLVQLAIRSFLLRTCYLTVL